MPCPPPFKATYKTGKKEVTFIAVEHASGPTSPEDAGLKTLSNLIEKIKPQGVVVETVSGGVMPPEAFDRIQNGCYQAGNLFAARPLMQL